MIRPFAALLALLVLPAAQAETRRYELDPVHSRVVFFVDHAGFSRAIGTFSGISGELHFDPADWRSARVEASVPIERLQLGDKKWNKRVLDPTFFNVKKYPQARFVSTAVESVGDHRLRVSGKLSLRGETQDVVLDVTFNQLKRHPLTFRTTAGFSAQTTLDRFAFGMDNWKKLVGAQVEVRLEVEATRERGKDDEAAEEGKAEAAP